MKHLVAMFMILGMVAVVAAGCATTARTPTDEELISQRLQEGVDAVKAKDFDAFAGLVSEAFSSSIAASRDELMAFLKNADDMGFLDGIEIDLSGTQTTVEGDKATISPVVADGGFGSLNLTFQAVKENGTWVIGGLETGY